MKKYIKNIIENKPINYLLFLGKYNKYSSIPIEDVFYISKKDNKTYLIIKNNKLFNSLFSNLLSINDDIKVQAALRGNSKDAKSEYSILNVKENFFDKNGVSINFSNSNYDFVTTKRKCMIIENLNNFCNIESNFINENINLNDYIFIWGAGNYITNSHFYNFLESFNEIVCYFDIDAGGFKFYKTLKQNLNTTLIFMYTEYMNNLLIEYGKNISIKECSNILKLYGKTDGLQHVLHSVITNKKYAEQEIFQK